MSSPAHSNRTTRESRPVSEHIARLTYSVPQAAEALGISRRKLYDLMQTQEIPSVKIGGRRLIRQTDLMTYLNELEPA